MVPVFAFTVGAISRHKALRRHTGIGRERDADFRLHMRRDQKRFVDVEDRVPRPVWCNGEDGLGALHHLPRFGTSGP